jgi:hypothetical protein
MIAPLAALAVTFGLLLPTAAAAQSDPLPSWNDGPAKQAIVDFVKATTDSTSASFVKPEERIATFDNDGTLWVEQPMYNQFVFALDEVKATADQHPEWKEKEPFKSVLAGDMKAVAAMGEKGMLEIVAATHSGMTTVDFNKSVKQWLETAKHLASRWPIPTSSISRCWSCSPTFVPMASRLSSFRAAAWSSCATSPKKPTAFRRSK